VKSIDVMGGTLEEAFAPQSVVLRLEDEVDVSRGDMLVHAADAPRITRSFDAHLVWLHEQPLDPARSYLLKHTTQITRVDIDDVDFRIDMDTLAEVKTDSLGLNDIGRVRLTTHKPLFCDPYPENRVTGSFILIDSISNSTVGAGLIVAGTAPQDLARALADATSGDTGALRSQVSPRERVQRFGQAGVVLTVVGGDEKRRLAVAYALERRLFDEAKSGAVLIEDSVGAHAVAAAGLVAILVTDAAHASERNIVVDERDLEALVKRAFAILFAPN